jgi:hypothetical protein
MLRGVQSKIDLIYKLENINAEDGVDIFEIAPILTSFGNLIRSANDVLGSEQEIEVKVKPFKEGSWIAQFLIYGKDVGNVLIDPRTVGVVAYLDWLGLTPEKAVNGVAGIVRFTKGKVGDFKKDKDGTKVTYFNDEGDHIEVSLPEHKLVQSPLVQVNYYNGVIAPLNKFPTASAVSIGLVDQEQEKFTENDKKFFEQYLKTELLEDVDEQISTLQNIYIKPKRGPYSGDEQSYSFIMGETVLWPVTMEDSAFLQKLKSGEIRPYAEDVLLADLEIRQKKDTTNKVVVHYAVIKVKEYIQYERPHQLDIGIE